MLLQHEIEPNIALAFQTVDIEAYIQSSSVLHVDLIRLEHEYRTICQPVWDAAVFELYLGSVGYVLGTTRDLTDCGRWGTNHHLITDLNFWQRDQTFDSLAVELRDFKSL